MSKALFKSALRAIRHSFSRFVSIVIIVAVGIGFAVGFQAAVPDMRVTANQYFAKNNLMDIRVQSTLGLTPHDLRDLQKIEGVEYLMPVKFVDALVWVDGKVESDIDGSQISARAYSLNLTRFADFNKDGKNDGNFINRPTLIDGTYPTKANECLVDRSKLSTPESYQIGATIRLDGGAEGDSIFASLDINEFKIVGVIESPYYLSFERGNTLVGSGKVGTFIYIPDEAFITDYYTEAYVTVEGSDAYDAFSQEYYDTLLPVMQKIEDLSQERLVVRTNDLNAKLPAQILEGEAELKSKREQLDISFGEARNQLEQLKQLAENGNAIYANAEKEFKEKFGAAQAQLNASDADLQAKINAYNVKNAAKAKAQADWNNFNAKLTQVEREAEQYLTQYKELKSKMDSAQATVNATKNLLETSQGIMNTLVEQQDEQMNNEDLKSIIGVLQDFNPELYTAVIGITGQGLARQAMNLIQPQIDSYKMQLAQQQDALNEARRQYDAKKPEVEKWEKDIAAARNLLNSKQVELNAASAQLESARQAIESYSSQLGFANQEMVMEYVKAQSELSMLRTRISTAPTDYETSKKAYDEAAGDAEKQIRLAETKLEAAKNQLARVADARWNIYDRNDTPGFTSYKNAMDTVQVVANIFPIFFVLVAALISLTTITRMVEEDRVNFGTLFALGYRPGSVIMKYVLYALLASLFGSAIGLALGFFVIPRVIFSAWGIMFEMPDLVITFPWLFIILGIFVSVLSTVGAALFACRKDIRVKPATLMRPKPPKGGRRVLLERIGFIWSRLSFTSKVTVRNLMRNPRRFWMTLVGMSGCTALLLAATGFYGSVEDIMTRQYGESGIAKYDMQLVFAHAQKPGESEVMDMVQKDSRVESAMPVSMQSMEGGSERTKKLHEVYVYVPADASRLGDYIKLYNRKNRETLTLEAGQVIATEKFARQTDTSVGDTVFVQDADGRTTTLTVTGIVENYTFSYLYVAPDAYRAAFGSEPSYTYAVGRLTESVKSAAAEAAAGSATDKSQLAVDLMADEEINAVAYTTDTMTMFSEIVRTISILVLLFIAAAIILALVVLYNLSNININERTRELATLKVVGFYDNEVSDYIHRENYLMTFMSILLGLVFGTVLHRLLVNLTEVDMVMFGQRIHWLAYVVAAVLSLLFSLLINLVMRGKLRRVNMVESFKSVE